MVALNEEEKRIIEQFQSLDPQRRQFVLLEMARTDADGWKRFQNQGESRLREFARAKGLDWERLDDEQRQDLVEEIADGGGA